MSVSSAFSWKVPRHLYLIFVYLANLYLKIITKLLSLGPNIDWISQFTWYISISQQASCGKQALKSLTIVLPQKKKLTPFSYYLFAWRSVLPFLIFDVQYNISLTFQCKKKEISAHKQYLQVPNTVSYHFQTWLVLEFFSWYIDQYILNGENDIRDKISRW